ncbi:oligosaccharide flippase family protein, partial [Providencia rettgeri]|uniref:oligosaccharide flippase family protein n=1 Tax=Providencia rettgeri TaxID=587 RepID=UPI0031F3F33E
MSNILISSIYYFRKFTPDIKLSYINFDSKLAKKLLSFSSWLLISQIGFILFAKIDLLLVNLYLGDQKSGEYAIISQLTSQLRTAFGVVAGVLGPFILIKYSQLNKIKFSKLIINLYSTSSFLLFIPIIIIFIYSNEILKFWLGEDFSHLSSTLKILILGVGLMVAPTPLYAYINTASHVKFAAIISISSGVLNLIIAIFLLEFTSLSYNGVALASLSCIALRDIIIIPLFSFYKLNYSTYNFIT